jgi:hypothetical protein
MGLLNDLRKSAEGHDGRLSELEARIAKLEAWASLPWWKRLFKRFM